MASHSTKQKDNFIRNILLGFGGVILALVLVLIVIEVNSPQYDDFDHLTSYQAIERQDEDQYLVYYYSETCSYCAEIKDTVLKFAKNNKADLKVYIMQASPSISGVNNIVNPNNANDPMDGTPALVTVVDGQVVDLNSGAVDIPNVLELINEGTYTYID